MIRTFCRRLLLAALALTIIASPVWASSTIDQFLENVNKGLAAANNYNYDSSIGYVNSAEIQYRRALQEMSKAGQDPQEIWKINLAMQTNLVLLYNMLGQRFFDQDKYAQALQMYNKSQAINATFPCTHYEKGYTYLRLKDTWKAAVEIYEAKRLVRFPAYRRIVNHYDDDGSINCSREDVETRGDGILHELGKSTDYPVGLDLVTGKAVPNQMVPGIGLHLASLKKAVYIGESLAQVLDDLGKPLSQDDETESDRGETLRIYVFQNPRIVVCIDTTSETVKQIHVFEPNIPVASPAGQIKTGVHAREVLRLLGQGYGFQRSPNGVNADIREYLDYPEIGLVFGVGKNDLIVTAAIYNLE